MTFADPGDLNTGDVFPEAWADQVRANFLALSTWGTYTPTVTQSGAVTKTVNVANYVRLGDLVIAQVGLTITGSGSAGSVVTVTLPVNATTTALIMGFGHWFDASLAINYPWHAYVSTATTLIFFRTDTTAGSAAGADPNVALANGDGIDFTVIYQAA